MNLTFDHTMNYIGTSVSCLLGGWCRLSLKHGSADASATSLPLLATIKEHGWRKDGEDISLSRGDGAF